MSMILQVFFRVKMAQLEKSSPDFTFQFPELSLIFLSKLFENLVHV